MSRPKRKYIINLGKYRVKFSLLYFFLIYNFTTSDESRSLHGQAEQHDAKRGQ